MADLGDDCEPDCTCNWTDWLADREDTIDTATVTITSGTATITDVTHDDTTVTYWLSDAEPGNVHATIHIVTDGGREDDRTMRFVIVEQ